MFGAKRIVRKKLIKLQRFCQLIYNLDILYFSFSCALMPS